MATFTKTTKNTATWGKTSQHTATWAKTAQSGTMSFIQLENGGYLLQEDGTSKLILEQSSSSGTSWTKLTKN